MTRYSFKAKSLPAPVRALPYLIRAFTIAMIVVWLPSCVGPEGMVRASEIKAAVDIVTERHDAMIRGELDPQSLGGEGPEVEVLRRTALRTSEMLRDVVDTAAGKGN